MAEHIVSGGGNALNAFLGNETAYTDNDLILVEPGIYSHVLFNKYRRNVVVRSTEGKEKTIIDGEGMYPCFRNNYVNNSYIYTLDGFSLSNGYVSTDVSADSLVPGTWMEAGCIGACRFLNCGFYDCSAFSLSAELNGRLGIAYTNTTEQYPSYTYFKNCELSGNVSNTNQMFRGIFLNCDIHHNRYYRTHRGDRYAANGTFYACKIHHNEMSGIWGGASYADCLIYRNHGNNNWFNERSRAENCTFANNDGITHLDNNYGDKTWYKNCVFYKNFRKDGVTRSGANWGSSSRGTININNYFDQLSTTMTWYTPMTSALVSGDAFLPGVNFGFVDEENDDYHLRPDSILISAGTNYRMSDFEMLTSGDKNRLTALERYADLFGNTDFDGKPFDEEHPSVGAYQFAAEKPNLPNKVYPFGTREEKEWAPIPIYTSKIEYLESSGTQWVNTNLYPSGQTYYFYIDFLSKTFTGSPEMEVWGCWGGGVNWNCWANKNESTLTLISGTRGANNRVIMGRALTGTSSRPICLFAWLNSQHPSTGVQIFSYKVFRNNSSGELIQNLIPVRIGTVGYFYDTVSNTFLPNAGTGEFILGPDVQS